MDDDRSGCALAGGFFKFVRPATIIGHGLALEELCITCGETGIVHQDDNCLARVVLVSVVVPVIFRRDDTITNEDHIRWCERNLIGVLMLGPDD